MNASCNFHMHFRTPKDFFAVAAILENLKKDDPHLLYNESILQIAYFHEESTLTEKDVFSLIQKIDTYLKYLEYHYPDDGRFKHVEFLLVCECKGDEPMIFTVALKNGHLMFNGVNEDNENPGLMTIPTYPGGMDIPESEIDTTIIQTLLSLRH